MKHDYGNVVQIENALYFMELLSFIRFLFFSSKCENCCSIDNKGLDFIKHILGLHLTSFENCPLSYS